MALLGRLRNAVPWLERIAARLLARHGKGRSAAGGKGGAAPGRGRLIRLIDATNVVKVGKTERESGGVWRIHAAFDLPDERLSAFEITDEKSAEAINRIAVVRHGIAMLRMDARFASATVSIAAPTIWPT